MSYRNFINSYGLIVIIVNNNDRGTSALISIQKIKVSEFYIGD